MEHRIWVIEEEAERILVREKRWDTISGSTFLFFGIVLFWNEIEKKLLKEK